MDLDVREFGRLLGNAILIGVAVVAFLQASEGFTKMIQEVKKHWVLPLAFIPFLVLFWPGVLTEAGQRYRWLFISRMFVFLLCFLVGYVMDRIVFGSGDTGLGYTVLN